ncbi:hypothetical protein LK12_19065 [Novosphingobium malaysiense]|uniref:Uncharacterized protein n=1 Tax=Novosphingobium malaysiense TaxID=1348853 RepID=A0A0B1ZL43_9SPHN|nr:hypothetical protein LK12_19065 [Novosphingobium malaysiense]
MGAREALMAEDTFGPAHSRTDGCRASVNALQRGPAFDETDLQDIVIFLDAVLFANFRHALGDGIIVRATLNGIAGEHHVIERIDDAEVALAAGAAQRFDIEAFGKIPSTAVA